MGKVEWTIIADYKEKGFREIRRMESDSLSENREFFASLFDNIYHHLYRQIKYWTK